MKIYTFNVCMLRLPPFYAVHHDSEKKNTAVKISITPRPSKRILPCSSPSFPFPSLHLIFTSHRLHSRPHYSQCQYSVARAPQAMRQQDPLFLSSSWDYQHYPGSKLLARDHLLGKVDLALFPALVLVQMVARGTGMQWTVERKEAQRQA